MATPSLAMIPSGYKDGTLYNVLPNNATGDFDVTRGSLATRVNKDGLIEPVGTLGADVVLNGDFEELGADQVLNGDFSQESAELIVNGDFATDSDWVRGPGWTISGGSANTDGVSGADIKQDNVTVVGKSYKYSFTISNSGVGVIEGRFRNQSGGFIVNFSAEGTYEGYFTADDTFANFVNLSGNTTSYSIDNVSVVEVGQNWTLTGLVSVGNGVASFVDNGTNLNSSVIQSNAVVADTSYKVSFDVSRYVLGGVQIRVGGADAVSDHLSQGVGTYTFYVKSGNTTNFEIKRWGAYPNFDFDITNITVEEVGQEWTLTDGCSITAQGARITSDGTIQSIQQVGALVVGDTYEVEYEITEYVSGVLTLADSFGSGFLLKTTLGVHKFYGVATHVNLRVKRNGGVTDVTIDNIKVKRLNGDDTPRIDYTDGGCPVLLTEPQSTNLIVQSNDAVSLNGGVVEPSSGTSPDGTQNAFKVTFGVGSNDGATLYINGSTALPSTEYTFSVYAKSVNGDGTFKVRIDTNTQALVADNNITSTSEWQRYSFTFTTDAACSSFGGNTRFKSITANNEVLFYGLQVEELSYSTSLIPTYGAVRTRLQDSVNGAGTSSDFNSTEGVVFAEIKKEESNTSTSLMSLLGSGTDRVSMYYFGVNQFYADIVSSSVSITMNCGTIDTSDYIKVAVKYKNNDSSVWINGVEVATDLRAVSLVGLDEMSLKNGTDNFFGKTSQIQVFKTALSDFELTQLTTI